VAAPAWVPAYMRHGYGAYGQIVLLWPGLRIPWSISTAVAEHWGQQQQQQPDGRAGAWGTLGQSVGQQQGAGSSSSSSRMGHWQ
jgi:hypothetical protein